MASLLAACLFHSRRRGDRIEYRPPTEPAQLLAFLKFSGLAHLMGHGPAPDTDHPQSETVPITAFREVTIQQADPVVRLVQRHSETLSDDAEERLRGAIREVMQNVLDHANSPIGGVLAARYIRSRSEIRAAIVDLGDTIPTVLARGGITDTSESLTNSLDHGGITTRSTPHNSGLGLYWLRQHVEAARGSLLLFTGGIVATCSHSGAGFRTHVDASDVYFPGTGVFFTLKMDPARVR